MSPASPRAAFSICAVSAVLVGGLGLTPASAQNSVPTSQSSSVEYRLDVLAEQALTIDELEETASAFVAVGQESSAEIPKDAIEPIVLGAESETKIGIFLPDSEETSTAKSGEFGEIAFEHNNSSSTSVLPYEDGSVQMVTTIEEASAPQEYTYNLELPDDASLELLEDGMVLVRDAEGNFVAGVAAPWAKDANGTDVPTRYEIRGSSLVQVIEHDTPGVDYPVTADPFWGKNLFTGFSRDWYEGDVRYNGSVTVWGALVMSGGGGVGGYLAGQGIMRNQGWAEWTSRFPTITNKATLRHQYECHVAASTYGLPWTGAYNLERFRSDKPHWWNGVIHHHCNW
ncbi:hypothetical protein [Rothia sp. 88186D007BW]